MIDIPKAILNKAKMEGSTEHLEDYLLNNYPVPAIIKAFAELIIISDNYTNKPQILVSEEEMQAISRLFRIKGYRSVDGELITERRGRPKGAKNKGTLEI